ncbi:MAG: methyltransferase domain-containing protein [Dehalococcoidia bacterium]|nr:methyltransferase domain-containing protein [Dehalococcoidia bacterium]
MKIPELFTGKHEIRFRAPHGGLSFFEKRLSFFEPFISAYLTTRPGERIRVLDIGCGDGIFARPLAARFPQADVLGLDIDEANITLARKDAPRNATFVCKTLWDVDPREVYDIIIASELIEHITEIERLMALLSDHLRPGGLLLVTTPNGYGATEILDRTWKSVRVSFTTSHILNPIRRALIAARILGQNERERRLMKLYPHVQAFTVKRLRRLGADAGLRVISVGSTSFLKGFMPWDTVFGKSMRLRAWDARLADSLPYSFANGWLLTYIKTVE